MQRKNHNPRSFPRRLLWTSFAQFRTSSQFSHLVYLGTFTTSPDLGSIPYRNLLRFRHATPRTAASWLSSGSSPVTAVNSSAAPLSSTPNCLAQAGTNTDRHLSSLSSPKSLHRVRRFRRFRQSIDIEQITVEYPVKSDIGVSLRPCRAFALFGTAPHHHLLLNPASNQPRPTPGISVYLQSPCWHPPGFCEALRTRQSYRPIHSILASCICVSTVLSLGTVRYLPWWR